LVHWTAADGAAVTEVTAGQHAVETVAEDC